MKALCTIHGYEGLYPLDSVFDVPPSDLSLAIYQANCRLISSASAVVANLRPFRGHEPDSGTVWEVAHALTLGKPVIGYLPPGGSLLERMGADAVNGVDAEGRQVEDFGLPLNLMLAHSLSTVVYGEEETFSGLEAALRALPNSLSMGA